MPDDQTMPEDDPKIPQSLRDRAKQAGDLEKANADLQRKLMFAQAGVNLAEVFGDDGAVLPGKRVAAMLYQTFDGTAGELTAQLTELGLTGTTQKVETPDVLAPGEADQARHRQVMSTGRAAAADPSLGPDPMDTALTTFQTDVRQGLQQSEALAKAIGTVMSAGARGDKRVIHDPRAHMQKAISYAGNSGIDELSV